MLSWFLFMSQNVQLEVRPICFNLQCFDCKIYHNIQHVLNLLKIGALYVPPQYKNKIF